MKASFNVLEQGWIPVVTAEGEEELLGIRETLARAHELQAISTASPLEEYGLYRFLGLFLMDALRPESETDIEDLCEADSFDMEAIEDYIALCRSEGVSFDLFDEERPFLQCKHDPAVDGAEKPVNVLDVTRASGNNHTHFDHKTGPNVAIPPEKAARLLPAYYAFVTMEGRGYGYSINQAPPYYGMIKGENLYQTLINLLIPIESIGLVLDNPPVLWRRSEPVCQTDIGKTSWMEAMMFPARRITLIPERDGSIRTVYHSPGEKYLNPDAWTDPYVTYQFRDNKRFSIRPKENVAIWRNIIDIVDLPGRHASRLLTSYCSIHAGNDRVNLLLFGVRTDNAKYLNIYRHDLSFPQNCIYNEQAVDALRICIKQSERIEGKLEEKLGYNFEMRNKKKKLSIPGLSGERAETAIDYFYVECEKRFWKACSAVQSSENLQNEIRGFFDTLLPTAMEAFDRAFLGVNLRIKSMMLTEKRREELYREIKKITTEEFI